MNEVKENKFYWLLVTLIVLTLIFSEWRSIHFWLGGERSISPADMVFLSGVGLLYFIVGQREGYLQPIRPALSMWYLLLPILLMFLLYDNHAASANVGASLPRFTLAGLTVYMVIATLTLRRVSRERLIRYMLGCSVAVTTFIIFDFAFTRCFLWQPFLYGEGTPALHFPFGSTSQAALFMVLNLIMGIGAALSLRKYLFLYYMAPVLVIGIFQTSSRSLPVLLVVGLAGFLSLILLKGYLTSRLQGRDIAHVLLSTALAGICLFSTLDSQGSRALSIFGYSPAKIVSGEMDAYRSKAWKQVLEEESKLTPRSEAGKQVLEEESKLTPRSEAGKQVLEEKSKLTPRSEAGKQVLEEESKLTSYHTHSGTQGLHNAYIDLWMNWGVLSLISFLVFIALLLYSAVKLAWCNRGETYFPLHAALLSGLIVVVGAIYGNPLLQLKFVWIFFALAVSLQLNENHKKWQDAVN